MRGFDDEEVPEEVKSLALDPKSEFFDEEISEKFSKNLESEEPKYWKSETHYSIKGFIFLDSNSVRFISREMLENEEKKIEISKILDSQNPPDVITIYEMDLKTGKKHQIRAHLSGILNTPVLFDQKYGFEIENFQHENVREFFNGFDKEVLPKYFDSKYGHQEGEQVIAGKKFDHRVKMNSLNLDTNWFFLHARSLGFEYKGQAYGFEVGFSEHFNVFMKVLGLQSKLDEL